MDLIAKGQAAPIEETEDDYPLSDIPTPAEISKLRVAIRRAPIKSSSHSFTLDENVFNSSRPPTRLQIRRGVPLDNRAKYPVSLVYLIHLIPHLSRLPRVVR